jgi:vacuolar-type H+-ATPase subunit I/STV1
LFKPVNSLEAIIMKKYFPQLSIKSKFWKLSIIGILIASFSSSRALALDSNLANSLITQLKSNSLINGMIQELNRISNLFLPVLKGLTNLSDADIETIRGALGQIDPAEAEAKLKSQAVANNPTNLLLEMSIAGAAAIGTSSLAANQVLSKAGQTEDQARLNEVTGLIDNSETAAVDAADLSAAAQSEESSQNILKAMAAQTGRVASVITANGRIQGMQNSNLQEIKTQLAALNKIHASNAELAKGQEQQAEIQQNQAVTARSRNNLRNYLQDHF